MEASIEQMLKTTIQTKVVEAFNSTPEMIDKLIEAALSKEVNSHGGKPDHYDRIKMPYLEWLVGQEIRNAARGAVQEYIKEHGDVIKAKVKDAVRRSDIGDELTKVFGEAMTRDYNWTVNLDIKRSDD